MKKRYVWGLVACFSIVVGVFCWAQNQALEIRTPTLTIEYGHPFNVDVAQLLNTDDQRVIQSIKVDTTSLVMKAHDYPEVGHYILPFTYKYGFGEKKGELKLEVNDTTAPVFTKKRDVFEFVIGEIDSDFNYIESFSVEDLSPVTLEVMFDFIDYDTPGEYYGTLSATDTSKNQSQTPFTLKIKQKVITKAENPTHATCSVTPDTVTQPTIIQGVIIANKKHPLPRSYAPQENAEAGDNIRRLIQDMRDLGFDISTGYSGYRSFDTQQKIYNSYVLSDGKEEAERYSARPGYSEHQTGLAFDLKHKNGNLVEKEHEAAWIKEHAHTYGFVLRYLEETESITGYIYEPWHLRYVGDLAEDIKNSGLTLEEYLGFEGGGYCQ